MKLSIIACTDKYGGISKDDTIPWLNENGTNKYPEDFKHFQYVTKGKICIMGRKTYEEIVEVTKKRNKNMTEILPGRKCYVLSHNNKFNPEFAEKAESWNVVAFDNQKEDEIFVIGGERLFIEVLPFAETAYITIIDKDYKCDKKLPIDYIQKNFKIKTGSKKKNLYFVEYQRERR